MKATQTAKAFFDAGKALYDEKNYTEAIEEFKKAIETNDKYADAYYYQGLSLLNLKSANGKARSKRHAVKRVQPITPEEAKVKNRYKTAAENFRKAYKHNPQLSEALYQLGYSLAKDDEPATAIEVLTDYIDHDFPKQYEAHLQIGRCYQKLKNSDEAISHFKKAAEIKPKETTPLTEWSECLLQQNKTDDAVALLAKATNLSPEDDISIQITTVLEKISSVEKALSLLLAQQLPLGKKVAVCLKWSSGIVHSKPNDAVKICNEVLRLQPKSLEAKRMLATSFIEANQPEEAVSLLRNLLAESSHHTTDTDLIGKALSKYKTFQSASETLASFNLPEENKLPVLKSWAYWLNERGYYSNAILLYEEVRKQDPADNDPDYFIGNAYVNLGRYDKALAYLQRAFEHHSTDPDILSNLAYCLAENRQTKEAVETYKLFIELKTDDDNAYNNLASCYIELGDFDTALTHLDKALFLNDQNVLCQVNKAFCYLRKGDVSAAIHLYQELIRKFPGNADYHFNYGNALLDLRYFDDALEQYKAALALDSKAVYASHNIAHIYYRTGQFALSYTQWQETSDLYNKLKQEYRNRNDYRYFLYNGTIATNTLKRFDEAEKLFTEGLSLFPDNLDLLYEMAALCSLKKQNVATTQTIQQGKEEKSSISTGNSCHIRLWECYRKATRLITSVIEKNPTEYLHTKRGEFYLLMEEYEKAIEELTKALQLNPNNTAIYTSLGVAYFKSNNYQDAIRFFKKGLLLDPDDMNLKSNLAEAHLKAGNISEAEGIYKSINDMFPTFQDALVGLGELYKTLGDKALETKSKEDAEEYFQNAKEYYKKSLSANQNPKTASRSLLKKEEAAVHYSLGYVSAKLYETQSGHDLSLLRNAEHHFRLSLKTGDANSYRAESSITKIRSELERAQKFTDKTKSAFTVILATIVFLAAQFCFFYGRPFYNTTYQLNPEKLNQFIAVNKLDTLGPQMAKLSLLKEGSEQSLLTKTLEMLPKNTKQEEVQKLIGSATALRNLDFKQIDEGSYALISFGSLLFIIAGLVLNQLSKLSVGALQLEKTSIETASTSTLLNIKK